MTKVGATPSCLPAAAVVVPVSGEEPDSVQVGGFVDVGGEFLGQDPGGDDVHHLVSQSTYPWNG